MAEEMEMVVGWAGWEGGAAAKEEMVVVMGKVAMEKERVVLVAGRAAMEEQAEGMETGEGQEEEEGTAAWVAAGMAVVVGKRTKLDGAAMRLGGAMGLVGKGAPWAAYPQTRRVDV